MDVLLDTNILARCIEPTHPHHQLANDAIAVLVRRGDRLCVVSQILYEYFVVCTRPQQENGGLGLSNREAIAEVKRVQSLFQLLPDSPGLYHVWLELIEKHAVMGKRAHDARIAAALMAGQIPAILTFNARDFRRYPGITVLEPAHLAGIR
jgi:predicted nucleic acid-binding protein